MTGSSNGTFTLQDLGIAYRKAKVDLYYSSQVSLQAITDYEEDLETNLVLLLKRLNTESTEWVDDGFIGDWTLAPKVIIESPSTNNSQNNGLIFSSPEDKWRHTCETSNVVAEFRLMANVSIDFHVLSALWILKVGHKYDEKLNNCSYGNRLRRTEAGAFSTLSLGSFKPYLKPFRDWRDNGIKAMRTALEANKKIVALTADVSSFYHELNADFMLDPGFNSLLNIELSSDEQKLHEVFINALKAWANITPLKKGLPVGLPASAVVANLALIELDHLIEQQIVPIYYGRYVDDIILVMENGANFVNTSDLWQWLFSRFDEKLSWVDAKADKKVIQFKPSYLNKSKIHFENAKNKVFLLAGETGKTLVNAIAHQIHARASEWRAMPSLPNSAEYVSTDLVAATQSDGEAADNLRKADALTMRRAGFAIKLRDFEAYERDLHPDDWQEHRHAFFRAFIQHVLVLPNFFELSLYLYRVLRLATACEDFEYLARLLKRLDLICKFVKDNCSAKIKSCDEINSEKHEEIIRKWKNQLGTNVLESITAAFPPRLSKTGKNSWKTHMSEYTPFDYMSSLNWPFAEKDFQVKQARFFNFDLAHMPFRFIGLPKEMIAQRGIPKVSTVTYLQNAHSLLDPAITEGIAGLVNWVKLKKGLPHGLLFATRPFNLTELYVLAKSPFQAASVEPMKQVVRAMRGFSLNEKMPMVDKNGVLQIPDGEPRPTQSIAVSSWKTDDKSWVASVMQTANSDFERYGRLTRLTSQLISQPKGTRYFILPELALPARWFMRFAHKLQSRGISFITGIEYLHPKKGTVCNQVWAGLTHDGLGFPSAMIYRQDKQRPALHEERELKRLADCELKPASHWHTAPVIQHSDFRFALLVCSELTNISYRAALRGNIDALFVPEWNRDTETFNALVESSALDIHAYIIQCNDRQYGDSRIRVPHKDSWQRDLLRVKGGITDYYVIGEIDVHALRRFQSSHRSPSGSFKPVPDGFDMNFDRKMLPLGECDQ